MDTARCCRRPAGRLALVLAWAGVCAHGVAAATTSLYAEAGCGQATYAFHGEGAATLTRNLLDLEGGFLRPIGAGGDLRMGSSLSLMPVTDRAWRDDSYALITFDMLKLAYAGPGRLGVRAGLGVVRVCAPVNEVAIGLSATVGWDVGPVFVGLRGRTARFEVDFEPHGTPPDTKYKLYYAGIVLGPALHGD